MMVNSIRLGVFSKSNEAKKIHTNSDFRRFQIEMHLTSFKINNITI